MNTGPIRITIEREIAEAVKNFARAKGVEYELRYHNLPLWIVRQKVVSGGFFREVQIAAYACRNMEQLYFVPHVYAFDESGMKTASPNTTMPGIVKVRLNGLVNMGQELPQVLNAFLERAWLNVLKLTKNDLNLHLPNPRWLGQ